MRPGTLTKERIDRAALRLFTEWGVAETSIRDIAQEAGVSQGAMYNHYASKEELASSLFLENYSRMGGELRDVAAREEGLEAKIRAMLRHTFEEFDRDWTLISYVYMTRHQYLRTVSPRARNNPHLVFRLIIVDAISRGEVPEQDPDVATAMVMGAIVQVMDVSILGRIHQKPLVALADDIASGCLRLLHQ